MSADEGLYRLYKLHEIDQRLHKLKSRAGALDTGEQEVAVYRKLLAETKPIRTQAKQLRTKLTELEDRQNDAKKKSVDHEAHLYDGSVNNPREAQDLQKEITSLKALVASLDTERKKTEKELEAIKAQADEAESNVEKLKAAALEKQEIAKKEHAELHAQYKEIAKTRAEIAKDVDPSHLRLYDGARKKTGNTGMALITDDESCSVCGIDIPAKTKEYVQSGRAMQCESCRRVLLVMMPTVTKDDPEPEEPADEEAKTEAPKSEEVKSEEPEPTQT